MGKGDEEMMVWWAHAGDREQRQGVAVLAEDGAQAVDDLRAIGGQGHGITVLLIGTDKDTDILKRALGDGRHIIGTVDGLEHHLTGGGRHVGIVVQHAGDSGGGYARQLGDLVDALLWQNIHSSRINNIIATNDRCVK